jgi:hypothetical protein
MNIPSLSAYHTLENSQGTLDPLGTNSIADRLATRLVPGFRERMKHPRYLTAMAVGSVVCSQFDEDQVATDDVSSPWQVYEWHVTSALVKEFHSSADKDQLIGLPGREKTTTAMQKNLPLSADRYLKAPSVFGFHGVYKTLAKQLDLVKGSDIGELGSQLVEIWEHEQQLSGFCLKSTSTAGGELRKKLEEAVAKGLSTGTVSKPWTWATYKLIAKSLAPKSLGNKEAELIFSEIVNGGGGVRADLLNFIASRKGQAVVEEGSEQKLHQHLLASSLGNRDLLLAIEAYENYCRLLHNAFYQILATIKHQFNRGKLHDFTKLPAVADAVQATPEALDIVMERLEPYSEEYKSFNISLPTLGSKTDPKEWVRLLFEHHFGVQRKKLPSGKAPWLLEENSGSYLLNSFQDFNQATSGYVHQYRTPALYSFLNDLGKLN